MTQISKSSETLTNEDAPLCHDFNAIFAACFEARISNLTERIFSLEARMEVNAGKSLHDSKKEIRNRTLLNSFEARLRVVEIGLYSLQQSMDIQDLKLKELEAQATMNIDYHHHFKDMQLRLDNAQKALQLNAQNEELRRAELYDLRLELEAKRDEIDNLMKNFTSYQRYVLCQLRPRGKLEECLEIASEKNAKLKATVDRLRSEVLALRCESQNRATQGELPEALQYSPFVSVEVEPRVIYSRARMRQICSDGSSSDAYLMPNDEDENDDDVDDGDDVAENHDEGDGDNHKVKHY